MDFPSLEVELRRLFEGRGPESDPRSRLQRLCDLLKTRVEHYNWFGFYIARRDEALLELGPFSGEPTEHVLIPFGRGICGQAAAKGETFVVDDVGAVPNYLACSLLVKSEIVVPIFASGWAGAAATRREFLGEIDIDSHAAHAFGQEDRIFLESLAVLVASDIEAMREHRV